MTAKEMFLELEDVKEYRENKKYIEIHETDGLWMYFDKDDKEIYIECNYMDEETKTGTNLLVLNDIKAINKQIEELGWNNENT